MIPTACITAWRDLAPWLDDAQVEQDLVLTRALIELFSHPVLSSQIAIRGGTAIHKLHLAGFYRYSEDIDLVWLQPGPVGELLDMIQQQLAPWLGKARRRISQHQVRLVFRFSSEIPPVTDLRLKIEINTEESFSLFGFAKHHHHTNNPWFSGEAQIVTYQLEELLATKLRALYQRKKGRDLFDLWLGLVQGKADPAKIVSGFSQYMLRENASVSRDIFEMNLSEKLVDPAFRNDIVLLLPTTMHYDLDTAGRIVMEQLLSLLASR